MNFMYIICFLIEIILGAKIICNINKFENGRLDRPALNDKVHIYTQDIYEKLDCNKLLKILDGIMYLILIIALIIYLTKDTNKILLNKFLPILLFLFYFRILCIWSTELPSSMRHNVRSNFNPVTIDHMFSSHTMFMTAFIIYINIFYPIYLPSILFVLVYSFSFILIREHYTIDVLIGFLITVALFNKYLKV